MKKPKSDKEAVGAGYEKLVAVIEAALNPNNVVTHNIKLRENCGVDRQIDVHIEGKNVIVECRERRSRVNLNQIGAFADLCRETNSSGIFVAQKGFSKNAIKKAKHANIQTFILSKVSVETLKSAFIKVIPEVTIFLPTIHCSKYHFIIDDSQSHLTNVDGFIYDNVSDEQSSQMDYINDILNQTVFANQSVLIEPLKLEYLFGKKEAVLGEIHYEDAKVQINSRKYLKSGDIKIPILSIIFEIEYFINVREGKSELYHQKDSEGNLISEAFTTDLAFKNKPYKFSAVTNMKDGSINGALIPSFNSSEIIPLKNFGELKNPFEKETDSEN